MMLVGGYRVEGVISTTGTKYVKVATDGEGTAVLVPWASFAGSGQEGLRELKRAGMPIIGPRKSAEFVQAVSKISRFDRRVVAEKVGWNQNSLFVTPDGSIIVGDGSRPPELGFPAFSNGSEKSGSLSSWKRSVAEPLVGQSIPQFGIMLMFAAPLLSLTSRHDNFGFELVGAGGTGKSTLQRIITSVAGSAAPGSEGHYFSYFDTTPNAIEDAMVAHSDLPLVLEEANLFAQGETARSLAGKLQALAFKLGSGTIKSRWGNPAGQPSRLVFLSSSNEALASVIGKEGHAAEAAADRLLTLPIQDERPFGVLDFLPKGYSNAPAFMEQLLRASYANHGYPLHEFLHRLVSERAANVEALRTQIEKWIMKFRKRAGGDARQRVVDAFGLVYAAGRLARKYGVLPREFRCQWAALACFRLYQMRGALGLTFAERLDQLARSAIELGSGRLPQLTTEEIDKGLFIREGRYGRELMITKERIESYFQDWRAIWKRPDVAELLITLPDRKKTRRKIAANHPRVHLFSFRLD